MNYVTYFLITLLLLVQTTFSQTKEYSLNELVNIAFQNNPQLKANEKKYSGRAETN